MRTAPAKEFISNFIKNEVSYINCKHPDFLGAKKSAISKMTGDSEVRNLKIINYISRSTDLKNENAQLSSSWSSAILTLWGRTSKITCRKLSWISSSTLSKIRFKDSLWRLFTNWRVEANATWKNSWPSPNLLHNNGRYHQIKKKLFDQWYYQYFNFREELTHMLQAYSQAETILQSVRNETNTLWESKLSCFFYEKLTTGNKLTESFDLQFVSCK